MNSDKTTEFNLSTNEEIYLYIGYEVIRNLFESINEDQIQISKLSTNYYSFTFSISFNLSNRSQHIFVKIPKTCMRSSSQKILPITPADRLMANEEVSSLKFLENNWSREGSDVSWVKLLGLLPEYNAIVTERIFADEFFISCRRWDLSRRIGFVRDEKKFQHSMSSISYALAKFHKKNELKTSVYLSELLPKIGLYCKNLSSSSQSHLPNYIWKELQLLKNVKFNCFKVTTFKGIDIRNVLIDSKSKLFILDPGKLKISYPEADIARFLMTYRALFWGSIILPIVQAPSLRMEHIFLKSYHSNASFSNPQLLDIFMLKEQLKHWHTALDSLDRLQWPSIIKDLVKKIYVNPFYVRQVSSQLDLIKQGINSGL